VERGAKLSSQLLAFARRQPLQPAVINPECVMRSMDDLIRRAVGETVAVETVTAGDLWNTLVDPHQLENVILNLAINARDAMPSGGKLTIEINNANLDGEYVASEPDIAPGQYVVFAVSDTGVGMTREVMERACEPFFTTKREGKGTGLGLSMAYGFVKQSGGHLKLYSEVGHGTTVKLYFPRSHEAEMDMPSHATGPVVGGAETILVVEDDVSVQKTVVDTLSSLGYRVLKADDADSALGILKSGLHIDLLFTDVVMPGRLRSPELARQAKALQPDIEVLFTSGYTQNAIVHGGRLDPGVQLLSKPYRREQLARKVRLMLANKQQTELARQQETADMAASADGQDAYRILLVEDNDDARAMVGELLAILGHEVDAVASAEHALERLAGNQYDLLFTDVGLPGMTGTELAQRAKALHRELRVIFATGYGEAIGGMVAFPHLVLSKPYKLSELERALRAADALPAAGPGEMQAPSPPSQE
jgi:CheY-like chemotaxis protein